MNIHKFALPLICGSLFALYACGDDSSSGSGPDNSSTEQDDSSSNTSDEKEHSSSSGNNSSSEKLDAPSSKSDPSVPEGLYGTWKDFHFVKIEDEAKYYSSIADDFKDVFPKNNAGRVIWSAQTDYYKKHCSVDDSENRAMRYRGCTVSEGIGYGMLITYFEGDTETFDRLWNYNKQYRDYNDSDLMPWITYSFHYTEVDGSSATDADVDIATSLILMHYKTGKKEYLEDAKKIINAIWKLEINPKSFLVYSGDTDKWKGSNPVYNLSYFAPAAFRLFAKVDTKHDWNKVVEKMYAYMKKIQDAGTGVFPDWSNEAGEATDPNNNSAQKTYWTFNKESVRIPWRIAWDYYWNDSKEAKEILQKLNDFIVKKSGGDPSSDALGTNYSWDKDKSDIKGLAVGVNWLGAWCLTGIGTNKDWLDKCTKQFNGTKMATSGQSYFSNILQMMFSQLLNGVYQKPSGL